MRRWTSLLLLVVALIASGLSCKKEEKTPGLSGRWVGIVQGVTLDVTLVESKGTITGSGSVQAPGVSISVSVTGTYSFPNVSMTFRSTGYEDFTFSGTLSADGNTLAGALNGSGFNNVAITLRRS
ncbi:MAG: hypothetical protein N2561_03300 [Bacteroidetes bacterium]|nr:hypothetical protein [Rhodothermia bacterium]MCS7155686.1 hypothetical protein [Bacteroidota bacterium]MCX7906545.1 hypothetical protein [Bacteroidota bacterium]MDW8137174.1 hypothetical protein [Bacteroidota bacterium]MDW8284956.1 hypothetical protein [Bacteroidota bacterium]